MKKSLAIFGATGSIGTQTLKIVEKYPDLFSVFALTANKNISKALELCKKYNPEYLAVADIEKQHEIEKNLPKNTKLIKGEDSLLELASMKGFDTAVMAQVGISGLKPTVSAIKSGKNIALANKEVLVTAGNIIKKLVKDNNVSLLPIDSEHSAVWQCMRAGKKNEIHSILLTASGGPFYGYDKKKLKEVSPDMALKHPTWNMGKKISVDSATLMNKGFEVIEACHLFDLSVDKVDVVIHRESVIHSMVNFIDGCTIAEMAVTDMSIPILYALSFPDRLNCSNFLDFKSISNLTFGAIDNDNFPCLNLCREAFKIGKSATVAINAANEIAVEKFLNYKIKFTDIPTLAEKAISKFGNNNILSIDDIFDIDREVREYILSM